MKGNLILDFGNTSLKAAVFFPEGLAVQEFLDSPEPAEVLRFVRGRQIGACILASVVNHPPQLEEALRGKFPFISLDHNTTLPIRNYYKSPATLGYDRIAASVRAWQLFPGTPVLAIVAGTCVTYNLVNAQGEFLGGPISPGLNMRLRAMHEFTEKLPLAEASGPTQLVSDNTITALRTGAFTGTCAEIEGFIARFAGEFPGLETVVGGGDGVFLAEGLKNGIFARPNLVIEGLNTILEHHARKNPS